MQLFLTSLVMRKLGVGAALLVLPVAPLVGTLGYLAVPTLLFAVILSVSDNSLSYSINQTAKETRCISRLARWSKTELRRALTY